MCAATVFAEISESATTKNRRAILYEEIILSLLSPAAVNVRLFGAPNAPTIEIIRDLFATRKSHCYTGSSGLLALACLP